MSNKDNEFERSDYEQQWGPGESPSYDAIGAAYAAVSRNKEALAELPSMFSRHSPEGFEEVLTESVGRAEDMVLYHKDPIPRASSTDRALHAAKLLEAWARGEMLEWSEGGVHWREFVPTTTSEIPNVTALHLKWRVKRTPRKVWVAFHESGSIADVLATPPAIDMPGMPGRLASDYVEFEEKLS